MYTTDRQRDRQTDRQTDVRKMHRLMPPPYGGGGIISNYKLKLMLLLHLQNCTSKLRHIKLELAIN